MSYPRTYEVAVASSDRRLMPADWNAVVASTAGARNYSYTYIVKINGTDAEAYAASGVLIAGGADAEGGIAGSDHDGVIQACIEALPTGGGRILLIGAFTLGTSLKINKSGVELCGEAAGGDHYFTRDATYFGLSSKIKTVLIGDGIDVIHVGSTAFCFGTAIRDMLISGTANEATFYVAGDPDEASEQIYTTGAGIYLQRGNTIKIENVQITCKQYGIYANTGSFAWDKVIDILTVHNLYLSYNKYGIYSDGAWIADSRFENIFGYLNYRGLIHGNFQYNVEFEYITSQNDNWGANVAPISIYETPIYIETYRNVNFKHVSIQGDLRADYSSLIFIMASGIDTVGFEYGCTITFDDVILLGSNVEAVRIDGSNGTYSGTVHFKNLIVGKGGGTYGYYGGPRAITSSVIYVYYTTNAEVIVDGGDVNCGVTGLASNRNWWFIGYNHSNQVKVKNVKNFFDHGTVTYPFRPAYLTSGTADAGTTQTAMVDAALTQADDYWNGYYLCYTSGDANGECLPITDFDAATDTVTTTAFGGTPAATDTYEIRECPLGENVLGFTGVSAAPAASTIYTVNGLDVYLTSTDSGNADCSITVRDTDDATVLSGASTIAGMLLPAGWDITWGAFTGAAPTVTAHAVNT